MKKNLQTSSLLIFLLMINVSNVMAYNERESMVIEENNSLIITTTDEYGIQWQKDFGTSPWSSARYEGPQPIGDCDNDGKNELLIGGRDSNLRVMKWDEAKKSYFESYTLHPPLYPFVRTGCGGFAIGDLTGDGKNEIAATWYAAVYRYFLGRFWIIGLNPWIFRNGGGSADCYIGDCDNDGKNELIMSGGSLRHDSSVPEIVILKWNGWILERIAYWDDPGVDGYVYMAGLGDVDYDGENEIVCGSANKVVVLNWDEDNKRFESTIIDKTFGQSNYPFACICKDSDNDGKNEIHVGYYSPRIKIFKWNGTAYEMTFYTEWPGGEPVIEGLDVGDTDDDGFPEVVVGAGQTHILQWNGTTYVEEAVLPTWGWMAVVSVGDCDNDGKNEINLGNVHVNSGQHYMEWVFKYGWDKYN
jgi:hypothetical protein